MSSNGLYVSHRIYYVGLLLGHAEDFTLRIIDEEAGGSSGSGNSGSGLK